MKLDLVMWAKNGAKYLPLTLKRIDAVIPHEVIGDKIFVDDHSVDNSVEIAKDFGWKVFINEKGGIGEGANLAFSKVKTEFFCSFEQDLLLTDCWFEKIFKYLEQPNVAIAQGWRLSTHPTLRKFEEFGLEWFGGEKLYSLDNNIYRTEIIRRLGGFPRNVRYHVDAVLKSRILKAGLKWITDTSVISEHLKPMTIFEYAKRHYYEFSKEIPTLLEDGILVEDEIRKLKPFFQAVKLMFSPAIGLGLTLWKKEPTLLVYYPLIRIMKWKGYVEGKKIINERKSLFSQPSTDGHLHMDFQENL
ncbi:MAG: glycosyltransferase [Candidatus Bathyarchaeia archaeon]